MYFQIFKWKGFSPQSAVLEGLCGQDQEEIEGLFTYEKHHVEKFTEPSSLSISYVLYVYCVW